MIQKYEKKRWWVEPSQAAAVAKAKAETDKSEKGSVHSSASSGTPEPKPLRTLVGDSHHVPNLVVGRVSILVNLLPDTSRGLMLSDSES